jgi:hypothetical protein
VSDLGHPAIALGGISIGLDLCLATVPIMEPASLTYRQCLTGQQRRLRHVFMTLGVVDETIYVFRHPCVSSFLFRTNCTR